MQEWLINFSTNHNAWVYVFIILFAFFEGPFLSMVFGVLIKLNYFSLIPIYIALMFGDLLGDMFWYYIGFKFGTRFVNRFGKYLNIDDKSIEKVKAIFHKHKHPVLFISKVTNGLGFSFATLITAGMVRLPFGKYLTMNILGQFFWTGILISIGYFLGNFYISINNFFSKVFIIFLFVIVLFIFKRYVDYVKNKAL